MKIKELREQANMNKAQFSRYFNIPYRTIQDWEQGARKPTPYLVELIEYKLYKEGLINPKRKKV